MLAESASLVFGQIQSDMNMFRLDTVVKIKVLLTLVSQSAKADLNGNVTFRKWFDDTLCALGVFPSSLESRHINDVLTINYQSLRATNRCLWSWLSSILREKNVAYDHKWKIFVPYGLPLTTSSVTFFPPLTTLCCVISIWEKGLFHQSVLIALFHHKMSRARKS